jgi:hypothetical protein
VSAFTDDQIREIERLLNARLRPTKHENHDHLDRALLVQKLKPSATDGDLVYTSGGSVVWAAASAHNHDSRYWGSGNFKIGAFAVSAGAGVKAYTGVGFRPALVTFDITYQDDAHMFVCRGAMTADGTQYCQAHTNVAGTMAERNSATNAVYLTTNAGAVACAGAFSSMDADGFSLNYSVVDTSVRVNYIAYR